MELNVGMYVRYRHLSNTKISKIFRIDESDEDVFVALDNDDGTLESFIITASYDITDLIKAGDVIETPKGVFQVGYIENNVIYTDDSKVIACLRKDEHLCFENTTIKSIVTKEQFNSAKYEVK